MSANRFGNLFCLTSFGESHGDALGGVIEGCPAGVPFSENLLQKWLDRRRPGQNAAVSARNELDKAEILSGVFAGKTLGTPIAIVVRNQDARLQEYEDILSNPRTGHADDIWRDKFGHSDHRGGGRASGRETLVRVIGGAVAQMLIQYWQLPLKIHAFPRQIGPIKIQNEDLDFSAITNWNLNLSRQNEIENHLLGLKAEGDSAGGIAEIWIEQAAKGLGQPIFNKLKSDLASAYMSVGATTGVELGGGFALTDRRGTEVHQSGPEVYGGIRGGISTGEKIVFRVAFKPTSSILDVAKKGRHDPCILLRALPVLEAMTYLVLVDHIMWQRLDR